MFSVVTISKEKLCSDLGILNIQAPTKLLEYNCFSISGYTAEVLRFIREKYSTNRTLLIAEVGVWLGLTSMAIAEEFNCFVFAIDWFKGTPNEIVKEKNNPPWIQVLPTLKEQCFSNIVHKGLWNKIILIPETSAQAVKYFPDNFLDLVIIDADHTSQAVCDDITYWKTKIKSNGYLIGDDIRSPSVCEGLAQANLKPDGCWQGLWWKIIDQ